MIKNEFYFVAFAQEGYGPSSPNLTQIGPFTDYDVAVRVREDILAFYQLIKCTRIWENEREVTDIFLRKF